jgi:hypothetical protein
MTSATPRIRDRAYHIPVAQLLRRRHRPTDVVPQLVARACSTCRGTPSSSCDIEFCGTKASDTAELANLPRFLGRFAAATWLRIGSSAPASIGATLGPSPSCFAFYVSS